LAFCNRLIESSGIHISSAYNGEITPVTLEDEFGKVNFYPLPFIKPQTVKSFFGEDVPDYTQAVGLCIEKMNIDRAERNVLITHQFVAGADRTESEEISVGGSDGVSASVFYDFDYVALGHIHRAQSVSRDHIRYSGTPLKYSFSESKDVKGAVIIDLKEKGDISFAFKEIKPLHDMVEIKGTYAELTARNFYENTTLREDYVKIVLTDEEDVFDAAAKLRVIYKNYMKLSYDNARTRSSVDFDGVKKVEEKTPIELFGELYKIKNNSELSDEHREYISDIIEKVWGTEDAAD
ncbi:MAG: exonuclease SbcCD subunit D C-terminal domain-containing protein, partial [Clostridia bacterium]|nr:exonuclease SbcCD subunit D C-terminal domain-containing protein [Clostridia bacterium]